MARWQYRTILALAAALVVFGSAAVYTSFGIERVEKENPPSGQLVDVEGGRLHLVDMGPADASVVVLLHGSSANLGDMRFVLGKRLFDRYHVILVDRPGHGWSDRPGGRDDAAPDRQAKYIAQALQRIGVRRAVLVAHSWGGAVALAYALDNPEVVSGLVLLAPLAYPSPPSVAWHTNITNALLAQSARVVEAPVIGPFFAHTFVFPLGELLLGWTVQSAFDPQQPPAGYIGKTGAELLLRPAEFIANGQDLALVDRYLQIPSVRGRLTL